MIYIITLDGKHKELGWSLSNTDDLHIYDRMFSIDVSGEEELKFLMDLAIKNYDGNKLTFPNYRPFFIRIPKSYKITYEYETPEQYAKGFMLMC